MGPCGGAVDTLVSIENATGSASADWIVGTTGDNMLSGGAGDDHIDSWGGNDVLDGGDGNDSINTVFMLLPTPTGPATTGALMIGGDGNDSLQSGYSNDTMLGGAGNDVFGISDYAATRVIDGGTGVDMLYFGSSGFSAGVVFDLNKAGPQLVAPNVVVTVANVENVSGSNGADTIVGDANANQLSGNAGADTLFGGGGDDQISGGDGDDYIVGGQGRDQLRGDAGADTFAFAQGDGSFDLIQDFTAEDHILFVGGPAGSSSNYLALDTNDSSAVSAAFAGEGVRYVAIPFGDAILLFADLGEEGTTYDQTIIVGGASLSSFDASSILGLV